MQLTGVEIVKNGIVYGFDDKNAIQQQGVDVRVKKIFQVGSKNQQYVDSYNCGYIPTEGKTKLPKSKEIDPIWEFTTKKQVYILQPGYYEVELMEGCKLPSNCSLHLKTRSSLVRCGGQVFSGQFDAGFETENMGCYLHVILPMTIECGARIAQAIVFESNEVENTYNGQWQGDNQRQ